MTISAISVYRGGAPDEVAHLARALRERYFKYGVDYRLSRFDTGANKGDWFARVTYADRKAYDEAQARFAEDAELQKIFGDIAQFAKRLSREMVVDLDL